MDDTDVQSPAEAREDRRWLIGAVLIVGLVVGGVALYGAMVPRLASADEVRAAVPLADGTLLLYEYDEGSDGPDGGDPAFHRLAVVEVRSGSERRQRILDGAAFAVTREGVWSWERDEGLAFLSVPELEPRSFAPQLQRRAELTDDPPCVDVATSRARVVRRDGSHVWFNVADGAVAAAGDCNRGLDGRTMLGAGRAARSDGALTSGLRLSWAAEGGSERSRLWRSGAAGGGPVAVPDAPSLLAPRLLSDANGLLVDGDAVFVGHRASLGDDGARLVSRVALDGVGPSWTRPLEGDRDVEHGRLVDGVLVVFGQGSVAFDAATGAELWRR